MSEAEPSHLHKVSYLPTFTIFPSQSRLSTAQNLVYKSILLVKYLPFPSGSQIKLKFGIQCPWIQEIEINIED